MPVYFSRHRQVCSACVFPKSLLAMNAVSVSEDALRVHCISVSGENAAYVFYKAVSLAAHCVS